MSPCSEGDRLTTPNQSGLAHDLEDKKGKTAMAFLQEDDSFIQREPEKNAFIDETTLRSRTNRIRRGMMAGPIPQVPCSWCLVTSWPHIHHALTLYCILFLFRNQTEKGRAEGLTCPSHYLDKKRKTSCLRMHF